MRIVSIDKDGNATVEMTAAEARDVRADIDRPANEQVTQAGRRLSSLLEWAAPVRRM